MNYDPYLHSCTNGSLADFQWLAASNSWWIWMAVVVDVFDLRYFWSMQVSCLYIVCSL